MQHHQIWSIVIHHPPSSIIVQHQPSTRTIMIIWHNHLSASIIIRITQESPIASIITEHHPSWSSILHPQHHRYRPFCLHHTFTLVNKSKDAQTSLFITWAERAFAFSSLLCNPFACSAGIFISNPEKKAFYLLICGVSDTRALRALSMSQPYKKH